MTCLWASLIRLATVCTLPLSLGGWLCRCVLCPVVWGRLVSLTCWSVSSAIWIVCCRELISRLVSQGTASILSRHLLVSWLKIEVVLMLGLSPARPALLHPRSGQGTGQGKLRLSGHMTVFKASGLLL